MEYGVIKSISVPKPDIFTTRQSWSVLFRLVCISLSQYTERHKSLLTTEAT